MEGELHKMVGDLRKLSASNERGLGEKKRTELMGSLGILERDRQRVSCWTRVMGYHRPVSYFNIGKKGEFYERKYFTEAKALGGVKNGHD